MRDPFLLEMKSKPSCHNRKTSIVLHSATEIHLRRDSQVKPAENKLLELKTVKTEQLYRKNIDPHRCPLSTSKEKSLKRSELQELVLAFWAFMDDDCDEGQNATSCSVAGVFTSSAVVCWRKDDQTVHVQIQKDTQKCDQDITRSHTDSPVFIFTPAKSNRTSLLIFRVCWHSGLNNYMLCYIWSSNNYCREINLHQFWKSMNFIVICQQKWQKLTGSASPKWRFPAFVCFLCGGLNMFVFWAVR